MRVLHELVSKILLFCLWEFVYSLVTDPSNTKSSGRGSRPAGVGEAPFVVNVMLKNETHPGVVRTCTGSIIDAGWILTAAHCFDLNRNLRSVWVFAGIVDSYEKNPIVRRPKELHIHPQYIPHKGSLQDIALIRVDEFDFKPSNHTPRVAKISIWTQKWNSFSMDCTVFGWGFTNENVQSTKLRKSQVEAWHGVWTCPCASWHDTKWVVCSYPNKWGGACDGDSGGPLVCQGQLVGITYKIYLRSGCSIFSPSKEKLTCVSEDVINTWVYCAALMDFLSLYVKTGNVALISHSEWLTPNLALILSMILVIFSCGIKYAVPTSQ